MVEYFLDDQRLRIKRNLAILEDKRTGDWQSVGTYKLPVIDHELSPQGHLGRFVAVYEAENNSLDLREHLTQYRQGKQIRTRVSNMPMPAVPPDPKRDP
jgi:hypothetical protein